jgi:hypothetical protein
MVRATREGGNKKGDGKGRVARVMATVMKRAIARACCLIIPHKP